MFNNRCIMESHMKSLTKSLYILRSSLLCVLLVFALTPALQAQIDTGRVEGTVKDPTGAVVPGSKITLTNVDTGVIQTATTSASGTYIFEAVKPGTYSLAAETKGFQRAIISGVIAHVQQNLTEDVTLTPGAVTTEVTVTSSAPLLQAEDASLGQTITGEEVNDLPLQQRNWVSLAPAFGRRNHNRRRYDRERAFRHQRGQLLAERYPSGWYRRQRRSVWRHAIRHKRGVHSTPGCDSGV